MEKAKNIYKARSEGDLLKILSEMQKLIYNPLSEKIINEIKNQDIVIFLGNTRSGKSTVVNYVIGNRLKATRVRKNIYNLIKENESSEGPKIGAGSTSETTIPTKWNSTRISGLVVDAPGFDDNRGESQDVANAFYVKELIGNAKSVKFVLTTDINDILSDNIGLFINFIDKIYTMLPQCDQLQRGMAIIFTKDRETTTKEEICGYLNEKIIRQQDINIKNRKLVSHFVSNPSGIVIFRMPEAEGDMDQDGVTFGGMIRVVEHLTDKLSTELLSGVTPGISDKSRCFLLEAHTYFTELKDFTEVLSKAENSFIRTLQSYEIIENTLSNDEMNEKKSQLKSIEDQLTSVICSRMPTKEMLQALSKFVPDLDALKEGGQITMKLKFIEFVDQVLQIDESDIFRIKVANTLSRMKDQVMKHYVKVQEVTLEITKIEAENKRAEIEKERIVEQKKFQSKVDELQTKNEELIKEQKKKMGFFTKLGQVLDNLF